MYILEGTLDGIVSSAYGPLCLSRAVWHHEECSSVETHTQMLGAQQRAGRQWGLAKARMAGRISSIAIHYAARLCSNKHLSGSIPQAAASL